ncbi:MAG: integrin, partial [Gammaproteobacteria bacterium]
FTLDGKTWSQQAYIKPSNSGLEDWFGSRLALSGDGTTLALGTQLEDSNSTGIGGDEENDDAQQAGAVYLFTQSGDTWLQQAYVKGSNTEAFDEFGGALALSRDGGIMVVGAHGEDSATKGINGNQDDNSALDSGAVYVFSNQALKP